MNLLKKTVFILSLCFFSISITISAFAKTVKVNMTVKEFEWKYDNAGNTQTAFTFL